MKKALLIGVLLYLPALLVGLVWVVEQRPPLHVVPTADGFQLTTLWLGEYASTVVRLRLTCAQRVVWEVEAADGTAQTHGFKLRSGKNACLPGLDRPYSGRFVVRIPQGCTELWIERGSRCLAEAWGNTSAISKVTEVLQF